MAITEADVQTRLRALIDPNTGKDFVTGKAVKKIQIGAGDIVIDVQLGYPAKTQHEILRKLIAQDIALFSRPEVRGDLVVIFLQGLVFAIALSLLLLSRKAEREGWLG